MSEQHSLWDDFPSCHELASGSSQAWEKAYEIFWKAGMGLGIKLAGGSGIDVEDVVQETIRVMMKYVYDKCRGGEKCGDLETTAGMRALFFQVLRNKIISAFRKKRPGVSLDDEAAYIDPESLATVEDRRDPELARLLPKALQECISTLPEQQAALVRCQLLGMTLKEAAAKLGINYNQSMTLVARARTNLRLCLGGKGFDSFA